MRSTALLVLCLGACDPGAHSTTGTGGGSGASGGSAGSGSGTTTTSSMGGGGPTTGGGGSGGTSTTGGTGGSGGTSTTGGTAGSTGVACADLPLCDDFENVSPGGAPDPARWQVVSPNCSGTGKLTVDGQVARSGKNSVRVDGKGGYCNHVFLGNTSAMPALGKVVYGRFFVRLGDALGQGHTTFLAMKDDADGGKDLRMGGQSGILMYNRESDDATLPSLSPAGISLSKPITPATWTCIEFKIDGEQATIDTWVDGAPVPGLQIDATPTPDVDQAWITQKPTWNPNLSDFRLGWESYAGQDMTLWVDDVALSKDKIGCQ